MKDRGIKLRTIIACLAVTLFVSGCGGTGGPEGKGGHDHNGAEHAHAGKTETEGWRDNDLDELRAAIDHSVETVAPEGQIDGGKAAVIVCENGCMLFKNHLFEDYRKNWSGISGVTTAGEKVSHRIAVEPELEQLQVHEFGPVSGGNGYVACRYVFEDGKPSEYWFYELDGEFQKVRTVQARLGGEVIFEHVMGDAKGNFHAVFWREDDRHAYVVISPDGEKAFEADLGEGPGEIRLRAFGGGRVAACDVTSVNGHAAEQRLYEADLANKTLREMPLTEEDAVSERLQQAMFAATPVDDDVIAWCDLTGVCFYDLRSKRLRVAYEWSKHEIEPYVIYEFAVNNDGSVGLAYTDSHGLYYLLLKPKE